MRLIGYDNIHSGKTAYIIGKGPSLDRIEEIEAQLSAKDSVVFCLNESIKQVEKMMLPVPQYVVQQDCGLEYDCVPFNPETVHFMNSWQHSHNSQQRKIVSVSPWNQKAVLYHNTPTDLSAYVALKIAQIMGIKQVVLVAFDALVNDFQGEVAYAACVGKESRGSHRSHGKVIVSMAKEMMDKVLTLLPNVPEVEKK